MAAAYAARKMGVPATIVVPSSSPQLVVQRLQDQGATVKITGKVEPNIKYMQVIFVAKSLSVVEEVCRSFYLL